MKIDRLRLLMAAHLVSCLACSSGTGGGDAPKGGSSGTVAGSGASRAGGDTSRASASGGASPTASSSAGNAGSTAITVSVSAMGGASAPEGNGGASSSAARAGGQAGSGGNTPSGATGGSSTNSASGGNTGTGGKSVDAGAPVDSGTATPTCAPSAAALTRGDSTRTIKVGDTSRTYLLHVPSKYTGTNPVPLVIDFHGMGDTPDKQKGMSGFLALSDADGFVIAWPTGIDKAWNFGPCCTCSRTVDDLGFAKAIVNELASQGCIDLKRVYANGFSIGGAMTNYVACNGADVFAAATPSASDLLGSGQTPCQPVRPISVMAFRGTADSTVPYGGLKGSTPNSCPAVLDMLGAEASLAKWASIDSCTGTPTTTTVSNGTQKLYTQCAGGVEVGLTTMQGAGHTPGPGAAAWNFLKTKALP